MNSLIDLKELNCNIKNKMLKIKFTNVIFCSLIIILMFTKGRGRALKNIVLVVVVFCLTIMSAVLMITTDNEAKDSKKTKQEKTEQTTKKKEQQPKKQDKAINIKNQEELAEIIYSKQDEQTKMNAYNEVIKKGILPRSHNYQEAIYAYEESVWLKKNSGDN